MPNRSASIWMRFCLVLAVAASCGDRPQKPQTINGVNTLPAADTVFHNGHVVTMDPARPRVEAFAVSGDRIVDVGTSEELKARYPDARFVDLLGKTAMPGIIESHGHLLDLGKSFLELNVEGVGTPGEVVEKVRARVAQTPPGQWITGWGWDEGAWTAAYPDNEELSRASPDNPVYLRGLHGFASWVNQKALEAAGIGADTKNPPNGEILKDPETGQPTGILTNKAQDLVSKHIPPLTGEQTERALELAIQECLKYGLTSVHEARTTAPMLAAMKSLREQDRLQARIYAMLDWQDEKLTEPYFSGGPETDPGNRLTVRCIKIFVDGALGSRGAAMLAPYSDAPNETGVIVTPEDKLYELTRKALKSGLQVAVHAIGDRANRFAASAFERAFGQMPGTVDHRMRLEHAQVTALEDIARFAPLGVVLSMQPPHATSDMPWAEDRVGSERIKGAYAWRAFLDTGVHLTLNSDFPGETLNPFFGMYAAETRQTPDGRPKGGWYPDQRLNRDEVIRAYTVEAAYGAFEERIKGRIAPDLLADFIVLSADITAASPAELLGLQVEKTFVGGQLVHQK